ncbi:MAG: hypothetical protein K2V38_29620, partial [Gemmataceae bacterium]|nr:hypothetical protein [Gemmataceae bacterium]
AERLVSSTSTGGARGGPAGVVSNVTRAGGTAAAGTGTGSTSKEEVTQTDYLVPEVTREVENGTGAITRLTVAAIIDPTAPADGQTVISDAAAEEVIKQAIGFRPGRDVVTLARAPLSGPSAAEPDETLVRIQRLQSYVSLARNVSMAVAVGLAILVAALLLLRRAARRPTPPPGAIPGAEFGAQGGIPGAPGTPGAAPGAPGAPADGPPGQTPEQRREAELRRFLELARTDPVQVANVLKLMTGDPGQ